MTHQQVPEKRLPTTLGEAPALPFPQSTELAPEAEVGEGAGSVGRA